ncbi:uncharacterized protein TNCV_3209931 [Trichonephila clavipes]|nr:uncharacterized protein TNCV_3209931 [Trichonephila clavipes]
MQMIRISAQAHITRTCGATSKRYVRLGDLEDFKFGNCRKQGSAFDQVSEIDRGRIVAYRDCGLYFREIGSRVR